MEKPGKEPIPSEIENMVRHLLDHGVLKDAIVGELKKLLDIVHREMAVKVSRREFAQSRIRLLTLFLSKGLTFINFFDLKNMDPGSTPFLQSPVDIDLENDKLVDMKAVIYRPRTQRQYLGITRILDRPIRTKDGKVYIVYEEEEHFLLEMCE